MEMQSVLTVAALIFVFSLISDRIEKTIVTGPMIFVLGGVVIGQFGLVGENVTTDSVLLLVAEITLILLLFTDAIRIDLTVLRRQAAIPGRMLGIGLPVTVAFGAGVAALLFPELSLVEAALLASILAPTDAALGRAVLSNERVPVRIRQAINVESGLNDGLALPFVTLFLSITAVSVSIEGDRFGIAFGSRQVVFGVLAGVLVGFVGGWLLDTFVERGWVGGIFRQLGTLAVGVSGFAAAELIGGNGFVAAFIAGLTFGGVAREHCEGAYAFAEDEGVLLSLITFLFFGAGLVISDEILFDWRIALYVVASLTVVRMVPIWLSLSGAGLAAPTKLYLGWFGPRGVASILFGLVMAESLEGPTARLMLSVVVWTVVASVVLHGMSAAPLSRRYADWFEQHSHEPMPESQPVEPMPMR